MPLVQHVVTCRSTEEFKRCENLLSRLNGLIRMPDQSKDLQVDTAFTAPGTLQVFPAQYRDILWFTLKPKANTQITLVAFDRENTVTIWLDGDDKYEIFCKRPESVGPLIG